MKIGVVIARFQIDQLHHGHISLLNTVEEKTDRLVVLLGCSSAKLSIKNPLDYNTRRLMIWEQFPKADIFQINDQKSDTVWSKNIDELLTRLYPHDEIILFGSRDSFKSHYSGKFKVEDIEQEIYYNATDRRNQISKSDPISSADFRAGVIYAANSTYPKTFPCVDISILNDKETDVLLGRKPNEKEFRFIGGFVDPTDETLEAAAKREVIEETGGIEVDNFQYICSRKVNDWRYRGDRDGIITTFFKCNHIFGTPIASDDIVEVKYFKINDIKAQDIVPEHVHLLGALKEYLENNKIKNNVVKSDNKIIQN